MTRARWFAAALATALAALAWRAWGEGEDATCEPDWRNGSPDLALCVPPHVLGGYWPCACGCDPRNVSPEPDRGRHDWVICDCARDHPHRRGQERWT